MEYRNATAAVIGAGDFYWRRHRQEIRVRRLHRFRRSTAWREAGTAGRRDRSGGRAVTGRSLDARKEEEIAAFLRDADATAPLEVCIFNIGANVNFPLLETTERVFRKVWEMACYAGFLTGREAARLMLPRGRGNIFLPALPPECAAGSAIPPLPAPSSACVRWRRVRRGSSARRTSTSPSGIEPASNGVGARADQGEGGRGGARQSRSGPADAAGIGRRGLLADLSGAARRLVVRARDPTLCGKMVKPCPR